MLIFYGIYNWSPKTVAFRNDYCLTCGSPQRAFQVRTFDVFHIFWIPVLPLGMWKRWHCAVCGNHPHVSPNTRRSFKWVGFGLICLMAFCVWVIPIEKGFETGFWLLRVLTPVGAILTVYHLLRSPQGATLANLLRSVKPASEKSCPICSSPIVPNPEWSCLSCGIRRL